MYLEESLLPSVAERMPELREHLGWLNHIAVPGVELRLANEPALLGGSRFGGPAFVPAGFEWPRHPQGVYRFLGQIAFAEIADAPGSLPRGGLLALFHAWDEDGEIFWRDDDYVIGFHWPDTTGHEELGAPGGVGPAVALAMRAVKVLPRHRELRTDWPFDTRLLEGLVEELPSSVDYLLGVPDFNSLAYDPTPGPDWVSLLTVRSHDELDWCWHDGDTLMVFVERERLARADFSRLCCDAG